MKPEILLVRATAPSIIPALEAHFTVHRLPYPGDADALDSELAPGIRGLVTIPVVGVDSRLIRRLPNLEIISISGGHIDRIDLSGARARGIVVASTPRISDHDVADFVFALLLAVARRVCEGDRFVRAGHWLSESMPFGTRVNGKKLGIVGLGHIGAIVARRAVGFDMDVCYHGPRERADEPYPYFGDPVEMARHVDFLAVTCRSGPESRHVVDGTVLQALGPKGILVTIARGAVDDTALVRALGQGTIAGAGIDVFENEPVVPEELVAMDNVVLEAHAGTSTEETKQAQVDLTVENLLAHFSGRPVPSLVL